MPIRKVNRFDFVHTIILQLLAGAGKSRQTNRFDDIKGESLSASRRGGGRKPLMSC